MVATFVDHARLDSYLEVLWAYLQNMVHSGHSQHDASLYGDGVPFQAGAAAAERDRDVALVCELDYLADLGCTLRPDHHLGLVPLVKRLIYGVSLQIRLLGRDPLQVADDGL
jgi:hypothetical protein